MLKTLPIEDEIFNDRNFRDLPLELISGENIRTFRQPWTVFFNPRYGKKNAGLSLRDWLERLFEIVESGLPLAPG